MESLWPHRGRWASFSLLHLGIEYGCNPASRSQPSKAIATLRKLILLLEGSNTNATQLDSTSPLSLLSSSPSLSSLSLSLRCPSHDGSFKPLQKLPYYNLHDLSSHSFNRYSYLSTPTPTL